VSAGRDDRELMALAAAGDRGAFAELAQRHQDWVFRLAYRFSRDRQDAEELTQEILFKAWRHAGSFRAESAFATWLYRLAVNTCLNFRQARKARPDPGPLPVELEAEGPRAGAGLAAAERESRLRQALAALPARQRLALALASLEDRSYEEIAAAMGVSLPAVESLVFRARRNLAARLRPLRDRGEL
jgi:RNA polymerase sigma-70 factor (ECF subfamily)